MTAVADRTTAHFITCAHYVYPRGLLVDHAKWKRIPGKSQNAPIGFTFDKKEAFTADQPTRKHTRVL